MLAEDFHIYTYVAVHNDLSTASQLAGCILPVNERVRDAVAATLTTAWLLFSLKNYQNFRWDSRFQEVDPIVRLLTPCFSLTLSLIQDSASSRL